MHLRALSERGFTLLELMLAVALLGLLATISVPAYRGYVERARESRAMQDIGAMQLDLYRFELTANVFPETLAEVGHDDLLDPWGRPYVYLNIATADHDDVRKDKNLHPLNTDFDLYSLGRDGDSRLPLTAAPSRDDILRANDGGFIGRAENYN